eukprot:2454758-Amphidinium_carterae.1
MRWMAELCPLQQGEDVYDHCGIRCKDTLDLDSAATKDAVRQRYRELVATEHPDVNKEQCSHCSGRVERDFAPWEHLDDYERKTFPLLLPG